MIPPSAQVWALTSDFLPKHTVEKGGAINCQVEKRDQLLHTGEQSQRRQSEIRLLVDNLDMVR